MRECTPPSRPIPDSFTPPNGVRRSRRYQVLTQTIPASIWPATRCARESFVAVLRETYLPSKVVVVAAQGRDLKEQAKLVPLLTGKVARDKKATAYVCESGICQLPTTEVDVFRKQIAKEHRPSASSDTLPAASSR